MAYTATATTQVARLVLLPTEILSDIVKRLAVVDVLEISRVSRRLRGICLPYLFHDLRIQSSTQGLDRLQQLIESDARHHVVSLTYVIPELFPPEMMDFNFFKSNILPFEDYIGMQADFSGGIGTPTSIPYLLVFRTFRNICQEQRDIVEKQKDSSVLTAAFKRLPKLARLCLSFRQTATRHWIRYFMDRTVEKSTWRHHFSVISNALSVGRGGKDLLNAVQFDGLELPYYASLRTFEAQDLADCLYDVLKFFQGLRLSGSSSPLEALHNVPMPLYSLELCSMTVSRVTLLEFLQNTAYSIKYIGFHQARLAEPDLVGSDPVIIPSEKCCRSIGLDLSATHWVSWPCSICGRSGWKIIGS